MEFFQSSHFLLSFRTPKAGYRRQRRQAGIEDEKQQAAAASMAAPKKCPSSQLPGSQSAIKTSGQGQSAETMRQAARPD
jgi:hypothetical protein